MRIVACLAVLTACAVVSGPVGAAPGPGRLALMPLPRTALGVDAAGLVLASGSGVDSNADAAGHAGAGVTAADLARAGRITGYTLVYRRPALTPLHSPHGLLEVQTIAEQYRSPATARKGLAFWRGVTQALDGTTASGISVGLVPFAAPVGDGAFAFELTYRLAGKPVAYVGDVVFRAGELLGAVFVTANDRDGLRARTVALARRLAARIGRVLAGEIRVQPAAGRAGG